MAMAEGLRWRGRDDVCCLPDQWLRPPSPLLATDLPLPPATNSHEQLEPQGSQVSHVRYSKQGWFPPRDPADASIRPFSEAARVQTVVSFGERTSEIGRGALRIEAVVPHLYPLRMDGVGIM